VDPSDRGRRTKRKSLRRWCSSLSGRARKKGVRVGRKVDKTETAEQLLALQDELDALDKRESHTVLSLLLFLAAFVMLGLGMMRGSIYLEVNGLFLAVGGIVFGAIEVSKLRRIQALRRRVDEIEGEVPGDQGEAPSLLDAPEG